MSERVHAEEELLRRSLHELAVADVSAEGPPRPTVLVARGRSVLRRRRMAAVTASVALVGIVGAGGLYAGVFASGKGDGGDAAAEKTDTWQVVPILEGLLPQGKTRNGQEQRHSSSFWPYLGGSVVYDDGKGAAAVSITLDRLDSPGWSIASMASCSVGADGVGHLGPDICTERTLADGSKLTLVQPSDGAQGVREWSVQLIKPDDSMLTVREWNAPAEKGAEPTRDTPPLTQSQLTDVVTSKKWEATLDSLPRRGGGEQEPDAPSGGEIRAMVAQLAPPGLDVTVSAHGLSPTSFAEVHVDDGKGAAVIEVNIDHRGRNESDRMRFEEQDGVNPWSDQGTLRRSVAAVRAGGVLVVITAYDADHAFGKTTRATPPLTVEQLKTMAADDAWDTLR